MSSRTGRASATRPVFIGGLILFIAIAFFSAYASVITNLAGAR